MEIVKVIWIDAFSEIDKTVYSEQELIHEPLTLESVGWLLRKDEKGVTIAMDRDPQEEFTFRNVGFIPFSMVKEIVLL